MKLRELVKLTGGRIAGDKDIDVTGIASTERAGKGEITLLMEDARIKELSDDVSAVIVKNEVSDLSINQLVVDNPLFAFAKVMEVFHKKPYTPAGISDKAILGENIKTGEDVSIYPLAIVGNNVSLGKRVVISSGAYIGDDVSIGDDSYIYPNVTIRENITIGKKVIIHSGTVIGVDGFGYVLEGGSHYKIPQVGGVIIEDNVEIGANVTIDRATLNNTIVGEGTKIDNMTQIAHNVKIGQNCIIVSQVGISGSAEIGDGAVIAGQAGVRDHIKIGKRAILAAQSGAAGDIPEQQVYTGRPAIPHAKWLRSQSIYNKLPELLKRLQELENQITTLKKED